MNVELHILQNFAPSCLNRDDTNTPKTCFFGGVQRARISSQCFKRAMRLYMRDALGAPTGVRTRLLAGVPEVLVGRGRDRDEADTRTARGLAAADFDIDNGRTSVGLYLSHDEIQHIADAIQADWDALEAEPQAAETPARGRGKGKATGVAAPHVVDAVKALGNRVKSADIALFGRMMAENTNLNIDAACQVAHAVSTHEVETEMDFFTAVDDLQPKEETGAGMMGNQEFNSACFYRYALIQRPQLQTNLGDERALANQAVLAFVRAAIEAVPSARQNSCAAQNPPDFVEVVAGAELPRSLANAFERPVRPSREGSLVAASVEALVDYQSRLDRIYNQVSHGERFVVSLADGQGEGCATDLLAWLRQKLEAS